jgi:hypothetical protein
MPDPYKIMRDLGVSYEEALNISSRMYGEDLQRPTDTVADPWFSRPDGAKSLASIQGMSRSPSALVRAATSGIRKGLVEERQLIPNASLPATERPVVRAPSRPGQREVIQLDRNAPVGVDESGQSVDALGRQLGYQGGPALVTPQGDRPMRTADRGIADVKVFGKSTARPGGGYALEGKGVTPTDQDAFGRRAMEERYGADLKAMQEHRDADGMPTDQFPPGYFDGMSPGRREDIERGVWGLRKLQRENETGHSI